jgi:multidrug resistance efflux pump
MKELELQLQLLVIRAPISGTIAAIYCWPGTNLRAGDPIVTIAAEEGEAIVGYIREDQNFRPTPGMEVEVRARTGSQPPLIARVDRVGSQFEAGPLQFQRDPQRTEWVLPVWIKLPQDRLRMLGVRPGEPVDLQFKLSPPRRAG